MLVTYPCNLLRKVSTPVPHKNIPHIKHIVDQMNEQLLKQPDGIGIAAPQVGHNVRIIKVNTGKFNAVMINPDVYFEFDEPLENDTFTSMEGCLSVPNITGKVTRKWSCLVNYYDMEGELCTVECTGLEAAVVQHEVDHLDGILFTDHVKGSAKKRIDKKLAKRK